MSTLNSSCISRAEYSLGTLYLTFRSGSTYTLRGVPEHTTSNCFGHPLQEPISTATSWADSEPEATGEIMKPNSPNPIPFLKDQQELSAMFEPEKVAHYFRTDAAELNTTKPASAANDEYEKVEASPQVDL